MVRVLVPKNPWGYYYDADALDGDILNLSFADPIPKPLAGDYFDPRIIFGGGARVSERNIPRNIRLHGKKRKLLDVENQFSIFLVSQKFVGIIKSFQTEIQCFPVNCYWHDGSLAGERFFFFTTLLLDAINREQTTIPWHVRSDGIGFWSASAPEAKDKRFVFKKELVDGHHIWVDPHALTKSPFISETLFEALKDNAIEYFYDMPKIEEL